VNYLRNEAGDATAFDGLPGPVAEVLEATYLTIAGQDALARKYPEALAAAASAMKARPGSATAKLVHATLLMLTGDTAISAREAAEVAKADPTSVDAAMLGALVAMRGGDFRAARAGFERAFALKPAADARAYRAFARALDLDLAGAAQDLTKAIRLDPSDPAVQQVLELVRGAACLGRVRALLFAKSQLALPPAVQLAIYEGQAALARGSDAEAAVAFEGALAGLDAPGVPAQVVEVSMARETLEILLAKALRATAAADPAVEARMDALVADVERRHPTWPSPHYIRGGFAQKNGDVERALAEFAKCRTMDPAGDMLLQQQMPADSASLRSMCAVLEVTLLLMSKGGPGDPRMGPTLDRLEAALHGTSAAPVVGVLRDLMVVDGAGGKPPSPEASDALRAKFRAVAKSLAGTPPGSYGPAEALLRAMFHGMHVNAELMVGLDGVAEALAPLRSLAPRDDVYEAVWNAVATIRKEAVMATFAKVFQDLDADPRAREADQIAVRDPEGARKMVESVVAPVRASLGRFGEPVLTFVVELLVRSGTDATIAKGMAERVRRIDRVLEVALDPAKVAKLEASKRDLVEQLKRLDAAAKEHAAEGRRAAFTTFATPVDLQTFQLAAAQIAQRDPSSPIGVPGPDDARRAAELKLLAYLRALSIPAPEGLK
jgi:tetratricopeptide (TPR) repeat protein